MDKYLLQETYDQIQLNEEQKERILSNLTKEQNKSTAFRMKSWGYRAAVMVVALLVFTSASVFAAKEFDIANLIGQIYKDIYQTKANYTQEEKEMYEKIGTLLGKEVKINTGTVMLDAVLYDSNMIIVPFTFKKNPKLTEPAYQLVEEGDERVEISLENGKTPGNITYDFGNKEVVRGHYEIHFDNKGEHIEKGDKVIIKRVREYDRRFTKNKVGTARGGCTLDIEEVDSFVLEKDISSMTRKVLDGDYKLSGGMVLKDITVSPLSISLTTSYEPGRYYPYSSVNWDRVKIFKKDGSEVGGSDIFGAYSSMLDEGTLEVLLMPFKSPMSLDELDYVQIELVDETYKIPIH